MRYNKSRYFLTIPVIRFLYPILRVSCKLNVVRTVSRLQAGLQWLQAWATAFSFSNASRLGVGSTKPPSLQAMGPFPQGQNGQCMKLTNVFSLELKISKFKKRHKNAQISRNGSNNNSSSSNKNQTWGRTMWSTT